MMENHPSSSDDGGGPFIPVKSPSPSKKKNNQVGNIIKTKPEFTLAVQAHFPHSPSFNPVAHAKALFGHLVAADSDAVICILSDKSEDSEPSLLSPDAAFPSLEVDFKKYFKVYKDKKVTKKLKVVIAFTVTTSHLLNDIKFDPDQTILLNWLKEEKIFLECDNLRLDKIAYAGYFIQNSPHIFHHASHKAQINSILHLIEMTDEDAVAHDEEQCSHVIKLANKGKSFSVQVLDFELESCKLGYGKGTARVSTDAICIKCSAKKMDLLKELLTRAAADNLLYASGIYIPPGSANQISSEAYINIITAQNKYLAETTAISVQGLSHDAFEVTVPFTEDGHPTKVSNIFLSQEWCESIKPTNIKDKYLFVIKKVNKVEACQWLDNNLEPLFMQHIPQHVILPEIANFEFPQCEFKFRMTMMMNSYATALKSLHQNPQSGDDTQTKLIPDAPQQHCCPPGCPNKWYKATQFMYNMRRIPSYPNQTSHYI